MSMKRVFAAIVPVLFLLFASSCSIFTPDDDSMTTGGSGTQGTSGSSNGSANSGTKGSGSTGGSGNSGSANGNTNTSGNSGSTNTGSNTGTVVKTSDPAKKRGLCYNSLNEAEIKVLSKSAVSWVYNWGTNPTATEDELFTKYGIEFYPMQWGLSDSKSLARLRAYYKKHPECKYLLAYNEPNLGGGVGGSAITPAAAAKDYPNLEKIAEEFKLYLVGPALQYSGEKLSDGIVYDTPKKWMDAFIAEYKKLWGKEPRYDYFCLHCYMNWPSAQSGYLKEYYDGASAYHKPIWLTEFCAWEYNNGGQNESVSAQTSSMAEKVKFMDSYEGCDKYAWFMSWQYTNKIPFNSLFVNKNADGELTSLGKSYMSLSESDLKELEDEINKLQLETRRTELKTAITKAETALAGAEVGTEPGTWPQSAVIALQGAIDTAKSKQESDNGSEMKAATTALNAAVTTFKNSQNKLYDKTTTALKAEDFAKSLTKGLPESAFTASSSEGGNPPKNAFDANKDTRWASEKGDDQWLAIDFGREVEFNTIRFMWEAAYSTSYEIQLSDDGEKWTPLLQIDDGKGGSETYKLTVTKKSRYVRFYGKTRATEWGHSFYEWGIFKE